ncbi:classical arabinogalactan protein 25, partial [Melia azedarach]
RTLTPSAFPQKRRSKKKKRAHYSKYLHYITLSNKCDIDFFIISMASFRFLLVLTLMVEPFTLSSASDHHQNSETSNTISSSPAAAALSTNSPLSLCPYQELSPDISPLLPSPGGVLPSPTTSSIPTIPSNPSPPNPDDKFLAPGPDSAFLPFGSLPASSMATANIFQPLNVAFYAAAATYCSVYHMFRI